MPVEPAVLDEVFGLLTLAHEREAEPDQHGRPLPPADPAGPRVAELAAGLGLERRGYPGGERFLIALTHDVDLLGGGGFPTAARKLAGSVTHRSRRRLRESTTFAADALRGRDPDYPLEEMLAAEGARGSTCFFLTRQEAPQDGYPERYGPELAAALQRTRAAGVEVALHASYRAREQPGAIADEARPLGTVQGLRHHYLRSDPARLAAELREAGLRYDSSIGWPSLPGLRAGTPYPYRLWDAERREPGAWELPLVLMDATLAEEPLPRAWRRRGVRRRGQLRWSRSPSTAARSRSSGTRRRTTRGSRTATTASTGGCSRGSRSGVAGPARLKARSTAGKLGEQGVGQLGDLLDELSGGLALFGRREPERVTQLGQRGGAEAVRPRRVRLPDPHPRSLDRFARQRRPRDPAQQAEQLWQRERPHDLRLGVDHGRDDVLALEAEHEVVRAELELPTLRARWAVRSRPSPSASATASGSAGSSPRSSVPSEATSTGRPSASDSNSAAASGLRNRFPVQTKATRSGSLTGRAPRRSRRFARS